MRRIKKSTIVASILVLALVVLAVYAWFVSSSLPNKDVLAEQIKGFGVWGYLFYFFMDYAAIVFPPLSFSLPATAGSFVFGFPVGLATNWSAMVLGSITTFSLTRKFGHEILKYFPEKSLAVYNRVAQSEKAAIFYFITASIPFMPGDLMPFLLGTSSMKFRVFVFISFLGNLGRAFTWAYIGSGKAFENPIFFVILGLIVGGGLYFIHSNKARFHLK